MIPSSPTSTAESSAGTPLRSERRSTGQPSEGRSRQRDRNAIAAALLGPLFYRRWFSREQIDAEFVEMIIRGAIASLHQDPRNPKREQDATN